ncbi:MAG: hypothetical protein HWD57_04275 [Candidatus Accumulibacter cognatus]|uniref:Uncharacterized protein n=1 Tax=Candidatus Accumulibacter cognatus TaxID=2954383 RepID=A0A7D5SK97_9PROT|nr:MAG: hypothetical protein HWD57_04275 [Candidatus Accumulibacter cognatus]
MNAQAALLEQWRKVLVFSINADDSWSFSQLPDARQFPFRFPIAPDQTSQSGDREDQEYAGGSLAMVMAFAALKLSRYDGDTPSGGSLCPCGGFLADMMELLRVLREHYGDSVSSSYLAPIGIVLEMALCAPMRLQVLGSRLDALDNDTLHRMAMDAVQGVPVPDMLADLLEPSTVAK